MPWLAGRSLGKNIKGLYYDLILALGTR